MQAASVAISHYDLACHFYTTASAYGAVVINTCRVVSLQGSIDLNGTRHALLSCSITLHHMKYVLHPTHSPIVSSALFPTYTSKRCTQELLSQPVTQSLNGGI